MAHQRSQWGRRTVKTPSIYTQIPHEKTQSHQGLGLYVASPEIEFTLAGRVTRVGCRGYGNFSVTYHWTLFRHRAKPVLSEAEGTQNSNLAYSTHPFFRPFPALTLRQKFLANPSKISDPRAFVFNDLNC